MKNEEGLRNCHRVEETKNTCLRATWDHGWDLGTEKKDIGGKTGDI